VTAEIRLCYTDVRICFQTDIEGLRPALGWLRSLDGRPDRCIEFRKPVT